MKLPIVSQESIDKAKRVSENWHSGNDIATDRFRVEFSSDINGDVLNAMADYLGPGWEFKYILSERLPDAVRSTYKVIWERTS
jgi:hypothetical protein